MKALSEATFKKLAGDQVFAHGLKIYNQGRVASLLVDGAQITASVSDTIDYKVTLHHTARQFEGSCECPASDRFDFCKHCVAASLAYYYQTQTNQEIADRPSDTKIGAYLNTLTKPNLVAELSALINKDADLKDHWLLKAEMASGGLSVAEIRKRITKAIPYKASGLWRFKEVSEYFESTHGDLSVLSEAINQQAPAAAFKLVVYALQRLEKTLTNIDDSNTYREPTERLLKDIFTRTINAEHWPLKSKISELTNLILDPDFNYDIVNVPYSQHSLIGEKGFAEICQTIEKAWQLLEVPEERYGDEYHYYAGLERMLVAQAKEAKNQERELQLLERAALHLERCLELVYLCIEYQQLDRAEKWLRFSEQLKRLSVHEIYDIESAQIAVWQAQGESELALKVLWSRFEESESRQDLNRVLAVVANDDLIWLDRAIKLLGLRIDPADKQMKTQQRAETLACIYIDHGYIEEAKQLHNVVPLRADVLLYLVNHCELNASSIHLLEQAINQMLEQAYQNVYQDTVDELRACYERCASDQLEEYHQMVLRVYDKPANKRKTNFIKLLKSEFAQLF